MSKCVIWILCCAQDFCSGESNEQLNEANVVPVNAEEHHDCNEYIPEIWDKALGNPMAMQLLKVTSSTIKEMMTDEVCSDTIRSGADFIVTTHTNKNAIDAMKKFYRMVSAIEVEIERTPENYLETRRIVERIINESDVRNFVVRAIARIFNMVNDPTRRGRLFTALEGFADIIKPSENEQLVKQKLQQVKGLVKRPGNIIKGVASNFGKFFWK